MIPRSLRARVTTIGVITLALVLGVGAWVTSRALGAALRSDINAQNEEVLDQLVGDIEEGQPVSSLFLPVGADGTEFLIFDEEQQLVNASLLLSPDGSFPLIVFETTSGFFEVESGSFDPETMPFPPDGVVFADVIDADVIVTSQNEWFETTRTVETPDGAELTLVAISPFAVIDRSIDRLTITLLIVVPMLVALGGVALWLATGAALRPVREIADEAERIAPSTSGDRLPVPQTGDEIAKLTETLNGMLDRLDDGLTRQRQFISDASHELRSPLTAIKGAAELVADNQDLPDDAQPSVSVLQRGAARLEAVLDDVTQLAAGDGDFKATDVDLEDLIRSEIDAVRDENPAITIDVSAITPVVVSVHPLRMSRAVQNLVANALHHAESAVAVSTVTRNEMVEIIIDDDGPGVPVDDRQRVFERFVRLDDARTRSEGGSGLGLAIVAAIAKSHGGVARCDAGPLGGARFVIQLPA